MNNDVKFVLRTYKAINCPKYGVESVVNCKTCPYYCGSGWFRKEIYCKYGFILDKEEKNILRMIGDRFPIRCEVCGRLYITNDESFPVCGNIKCIQRYFKENQRQNVDK